MKNSLHPYAVIFGLAIAVFVFATLRHPLFALFAGIVALVGFDQAFKSGAIGKSKKKKNISEDKKDP